MKRIPITALALATGLLSLPGAAVAQVEGDGAPDAVAGWTTLPAGPEYEADGVHEWLLGEGRRDLWLAAIRVPVLDLDRYAGGLTPVEQGGGNQSITLHFEAADGREYIFRSVDKVIRGALHEDLHETPAGAAIQDMISSLYPAGALVVGRLLDPTGILHVDPVLYVMPEDPRLEEFPADFAGMLGMMELKPNEGEDDEPLFAGSPKIKGTEEFLNDLEDGPEHQLNARRYVKARLFDFLVGDPDRAEDQWRFARFDVDGGHVWEPIPRDRDWALVHADGAVVPFVVNSVYPKLVRFEADFPDVTSLTYEAWALDRRLLAGLDWDAWQSAVDELQAEITDDVIADAIAALPPEYRQRTGEEIAQKLAARRARLREPAREYYEMLALEPLIDATDADERADIQRLPGGDVIVRIFGPGIDTPYFERRFLAGETGEVRLDMHGGADSVLVRGDAGGDAIRVRVMGGGGDDVLVNTGRTRAWQHRTFFYDHRGDNRMGGQPRTWVETEDWDGPEDPDNWVLDRASKTVADWGGKSGFSPAIGYGEAAGLILGGGYNVTRYGFRTHPYRYYWYAKAFYATRATGFGGEAGASLRLPSSRLGLDADVRAVQYDGFRFYGYGNETPLPERHVDQTLVEQDLLSVTLNGVWQRDELSLGLGPVLRYTDPRYPVDAPLTEATPGGSGLGRFGGELWAAFDRSPATPGRGGFRAGAGVTGYPSVWDVAERYAAAEGEVAGYVPLPLFGRPPTLALRAGGRHLFGDWFPVQDAAFIGGAATVRGYRFNRFAGRSAAWGSAELRLPLFELEVFTRGRLGVLGLSDAGRVWVDDDDSNTWHDAYGGGLWFESLGFSFSGVYAHGEEDRYYVHFGMPF